MLCKTIIYKYPKCMIAMQQRVDPCMACAHMQPAYVTIVYACEMILYIVAYPVRYNVRAVPAILCKTIASLDSKKVA